MALHNYNYFKFCFWTVAEAPGLQCSTTTFAIFDRQTSNVTAHSQAELAAIIRQPRKQRQMTNDAGRYMRSNCSLFLFYSINFQSVLGRSIRNDTMAVHKKSLGWYRSDRTGDRGLIDRTTRTLCTALCTGWRSDTEQTTRRRDRKIRIGKSGPGSHPSRPLLSHTGNTLEHPFIS